jgi:hypothetical protein
MSITDVASLLSTYNTFTATAAEITAWKALTARSDAPADIKAGLFGADLTKFNEDCVKLESKCKPADYEDYTGWAIGVNWTPKTGNAAPTDGEFSGVAFKTLKQYV